MHISDERMQPRILLLPDGRRLAWYEFGDPLGSPCIYTTGTPMSGLAGAFYDEPARDMAVRWISLDKPGYGSSDRHTRRSLLDWAKDVTAVADHLGFDRFAVSGESGGGPHALAVCQALGARVTVGILLAAMGPMGTPDAAKGMHRANRLMFGLGQHAPLLLWAALALFRRNALRRNPATRSDDKDVRARLAAMPAADRALYTRDDVRQLLGQAGTAALRGGVGAAVEEVRLLARPWDFAMNSIQVPVHLWHGTEDVNVPVAMAHAMAAALPRSTLHIVEGAGHLVSFAAHAQIMETIREADSRVDARATGRA